MPPLDQAEEDALSTRVLQELSETPYACSSLTQLTGGTANFVYRGTLAQPLPTLNGSTAKSIIVKHSTDFAATNRDFPLDVTRCVTMTLTPFPLHSTTQCIAQFSSFRARLGVLILSCSLADI